MIFHQRVLYFPVGKMTHALGPRRGCTKSSMCGCSRWGRNHSRYGHAYPGRNPGAARTFGTHSSNSPRFTVTGTPRTWVELQESVRNAAAGVWESTRMSDALNQATLSIVEPRTPRINPEWENAEYRDDLLFAPNAFAGGVDLAYSRDILTSNTVQWRANVNYGRTIKSVSDSTHL